MNVYFDNAATTQVRDEVINQISDILKDCFGNPSSTHSYGRKAKAYVETDAEGSITNIVGFPTVASVKNPIAAADYDNVTGELEITTTYPTYFESGIIKQVKLVGLGFTCADDYDVDGASATALLANFFNSILTDSL